MREKKDKSKNAAGTRKQPKRQQSPKTVTRLSESSGGHGRVRRENKNPPRPQKQKSDNPRLMTQNPRRRVLPSRWSRYCVAIVCVVLGAALFLMLLTFTQADLSPESTDALNLFGMPGAMIADIMLTLFGLGSFFFSAVCLLIGTCLFFGRPYEVKASEFVGLCLVLIGTVPLFDRAFGETPVLDHPAGGFLGVWLHGLASGSMPEGAMIAACVIIALFGLILVTDTRMKSFFRGLLHMVTWIFRTIGRAFARPFRPSPDGASTEMPQACALPVGASVEDVERDDSIRDNSLYDEETPSQLLGEHEVLHVENATSDDAPISVPEVEDSVCRELEVFDEADALSEDASEFSDADASNLSNMSASESAESEAVDAGSEKEREENASPVEKREGDGLGEIMARIRRTSPKSRSIKRSRSVPALEPEFEFDSILPPEQIGTKIETETQPKETSVPSYHAPRSTILPNWKPRSISRRPVEVVERDVVSHDATGESNTENIAARLGVPSHVTRDLIAQLSSGEEALEVPSSATRIAPYAPSEGAHTGNGVQPKTAAKTRAVQPITTIKPAPETVPLTDTPWPRGENRGSVEEKTAVPVSAEFRALMAAVGRDETPAFAKPTMRSIHEMKPVGGVGGTERVRGIEKPTRIEHVETSTRVIAGPSDTPDEVSFVVSETKQKPSPHELEEYDRLRQKEKSHGDYRLPPLSLLNYNPNMQKGFDHEALRAYASRIKEKLEEYKVFGDVVNICPGPVVTRFEYLPAPGTKVAKVESLSKDLMMALEIVSIRILAPIPGKNVVGIEIPNDNRNTIYFKEVIGSEQFKQAKSLLTIALGKDSEGEPVVSDLAKMPHLLVAGTTGSGKSVGINTMLCSLLYNASPEEVKLILVDPKMLELSIYEGIPHLLVPPITTPRETAAALDWACDEMDDRYRKLSTFGVRNIAGYNEQLQNPTLPSAMECVKELAEDGTPKYKPLPYIVIVVDEFADLMMVAGKEIEKSIARLAQKARAAGIHLILATQRPSTNVVTGVIKANFPTRLAFKVSTVMDSRVILDQKGAESLLGNGDSLFLSPRGELQRVHGAFVSDEEVQAIVQFLAEQRPPEYNLDITTPKDEEEDEDTGSSGTRSGDRERLDELYDEAVQVVVEAGQASASLLQRRLGIGFNRSARLIEQMEREGVVGPARGQKPRAVLVGKI